MTRTARWLIAALLLGASAGGMSALLAHRQGKPVRAEAAAPKRSPSHAPQLMNRVEDPRSSEYDAWLSKLEGARLGVDEVMDILESGLSMAQKNAVLQAHLRELSRSGTFPAPERWGERLSELVLRTELDVDLGQRTGRILGRVSSRAKLAELEAEYRRRGATLQTGNKLAVVAASRNPEFVGAVLDDPSEPLEVREAAVERVAGLGDAQRLEHLAAPDSQADPTLKVASVGALAGSAEDAEELTKAVELARTEPAQDAFGRTALNVAQVRASESAVDGKSLVLFGEWKAMLDRLAADTPAEEQLLQALVTGKAFSRALWTEADPATAARVIDEGLAPAILKALSGTVKSSEPNAQLQAIAEFAADFHDECALRAPSACSVPDDRRTTYAAELASMLRPRLADTELAFYAQRLGAGPPP